MRDSDPTLAEQIEAAKERLSTLDAIHAALEQRVQVMEAVGNSPDVDASHQGLRALLNLDDLQANAVLDMQVRRFSEAERIKIAEDRAEIQEWLANPVDQYASDQDTNRGRLRRLWSRPRLNQVD